MLGFREKLHSSGCGPLLRARALGPWNDLWLGFAIEVNSYTDGGRIIQTIGKSPPPLSFDSALAQFQPYLGVSFSLQIGDQGLVEFDLSSWTQLISIGVHYALVLCDSFKGCALPPSLLFHALFLSPVQAHKVTSTIFWRDNQKIAGPWEGNTV